MIFFKKQVIYNVLFSVAVVCSVLSVFNSVKSPLIMTGAPNVDCKTIIIDPGHGTPDGGTVGKSGTYESTLNLAIAKKVGNYLRQSGIDVIYTRESENSIADNPDESIRQIKLSDMKKRRSIRDSGDGDVFVSIHMNSFPDSSYSGAQVFYRHNCEDSKTLAELIQNAIVENADKTNTRKIKDSKDDIYLLRESKIPAVLVECGFLSNESEEMKLLTESYQEKIAFCIYTGILKYINS